MHHPHHQLSIGINSAYRTTKLISLKATNCNLLFSFEIQMNFTNRLSKGGQSRIVQDFYQEFLGCLLLSLIRNATRLLALSLEKKVSQNSRLKSFFSYFSRHFGQITETFSRNILFRFSLSSDIYQVVA